MFLYLICHTHCPTIPYVPGMHWTGTDPAELCKSSNYAFSEAHHSHLQISELQM